MQGWYEQEGLSFLPGENILPVWMGTHFRRKTRKSLEWLLKFYPNAFADWEIGCRDDSTLEFCRKHGITAYYSRCLTLTLPNRTKTPEHGKVFCVNCPEETVAFLPEEIRRDLEIIDQRNCYCGEKKKDFTELKRETAALLARYRDEARLVITTALHCAQPCLAMGIPVVFIDPSYDECDRFSSFKNLLRIYSMDDLKAGRVDFSCEAPDFEPLKRDMLRNLELSVRKARGESVDESELGTVRKRIAEFRIPALG